MPSHSCNFPETREGTVLLLEDDNEFAAALKEFIELYSCRVVTVTNGVDGLQKIMVTDFDLILCDMVMPTFPGDKFYMAVERIRPRLCERFIFMTGHQANPKWDAFIRSVHGTAIWKPFQMDDLLAAMRTVFRRSRARELSEYYRAITAALAASRRMFVLPRRLIPSPAEVEV
jgi:DNA-binding NtrC family response regulator